MTCPPTIARPGKISLAWLFVRSQAPKATPDGVVRVFDESPRFINVETVYAGEGTTVLSVPARVAFKNGTLDPSELRVVADVDATDLSVVRVGQRAELEVASFKRPLQGRVTSIGPVNSSQLKTASVEISLEGDVTGLRPATFGRVQFHSDQAGMWVPEDAVLVGRGGECIVYVARQDDTFESRVVVVGQPSEGRLRVLSGLESGERVATGGVLLLDTTSDLPF